MYRICIHICIHTVSINYYGDMPLHYVIYHMTTNHVTTNHVTTTNHAHYDVTPTTDRVDNGGNTMDQLSPAVVVDETEQEEEPSKPQQ